MNFFPVFAARKVFSHSHPKQYELCMMGIPIDGPTNIFCDNEAIVRNSTMPESTLKKKPVVI